MGLAVEEFLLALCCAEGLIGIAIKKRRLNFTSAPLSVDKT